jgi:hypothetical protein
MRRVLRHLSLWAIGLWLATGWHAPVFAQSTSSDSYSSMLNYLDSNTIDGNVLQGAQGIIGVNTAAGNGNLQSNLRAIASGNRGQASIQAQQQARSNTPSAALYASATISGHAYDNTQGVASINQVSGNNNTQLNGVAAALTNQGIRETTDGTLSATVSASAGRQPSSNPHAQAGGTRSVTVDPSAMEGFDGVMQLNQVAGSGNASDNLLQLSAPSSSH